MDKVQMMERIRQIASEAYSGGSIEGAELEVLRFVHSVGIATVDTVVHIHPQGPSLLIAGLKGPNIACTFKVRNKID
ncbi:MAG: hypothetical protein Q8P30_03165 [Candidatus Uhrbacteria bacterium]|nr:hypothetical protein [Candidatus Uhrbacteria bacterium]